MHAPPSLRNGSGANQPQLPHAAPSGTAAGSNIGHAASPPWVTRAVQEPPRGSISAHMSAIPETSAQFPHVSPALPAVTGTLSRSW